MNWKRITYNVIGTVMAYCLIVPVWIAMIFGKIRIVGFANAKKAVAEGNVLIIANHPSLIESLVIPTLFWWMELTGKSSKVPWTVADEYVFAKPWIFTSLRGIPVSRRSSVEAKVREVNRRALRQVRERLCGDGAVILYPEGGRTCKGTEHVSCGSRRVRVCDSTLVLWSVKCGANVLPVWVDHGTVTKPESFWQGYKKLFFGPVMTIQFGASVTPHVEWVTPEWVAQTLLSVGSEV